MFARGPGVGLRIGNVLAKAFLLVEEASRHRSVKDVKTHI